MRLLSSCSWRCTKCDVRCHHTTAPVSRVESRRCFHPDEARNRLMVTVCQSLQFTQTRCGDDVQLQRQPRTGLLPSS